MQSKTDKTLKRLMKTLGLDVELEEFKMGIKVELEHTKDGPRGGVYAVIPKKLEFIAKIAAAHLSELPDYYTRLKAMESEGRKKEAGSSKDKLSRANRMRELSSEMLAYVIGSVLPDAKGDPKRFEAWRQLREQLQNLSLSLDEVLKLK